MNILAVIPARGGSKGIPGKNIKEVAGIPLIAHAIKACLECSDQFHKLIVSTDDETIASVARQYGADVPFIRPAHLATDEASSLGVMQHALQYFEENDKVEIDWTMLVQATNPLVLPADINKALGLLQQHPNATSIVSVKEAMDSHPFKLKIIEQGELKPYIQDTPEMIRRQDLEPAIYKRNGSLYMTRRDVLMDQNDLYGEHIVPYIMPAERSIDIDEEADLVLADFLLKQRMQSERGL